MLLSPEIRARILAAHAAGHRAGLVVAPIPSLGRIPWAALPLTDPRGRNAAPPHRSRRHRGRPARLARRAIRQRPRRRHARNGDHRRPARRPGIGPQPLLPRGTDPRRRLARARHTAPTPACAGPASPPPRYRRARTAGYRRRPRRRSGSSLTADTGATDPVTVAELSALAVPPWCLVLGCDGSGASTGSRMDRRAHRSRMGWRK